MKKVINLIFLFGLVFIYSCNRDEVFFNPVTLTNTTGVYILSEGGSSPGELSFYSILTNTFTENIFRPGNLGPYPDGLLYYNNKIYITEQGNFGSAGKIYKTDTTGNTISSNAFGQNPYSITESNNKIYATNGPSNNVSVINSENLSIITSISVGIYPQELMSYNNKVYVCNSEVFGGQVDSTVSIIDAVNDIVIGSIKVRRSPSALAVSKDNKIIIGCANNNGQGVIYKCDDISGNKIDSFFIVNGLSVYNSISSDNSSNDIFFISGDSKKVIKYNLNTRAESIFYSVNSGFLYGLRFNNTNKKLYLTDALNFTNNGKLYIISETGSKENEFTTGIAPRRLIFK